MDIKALSTTPDNFLSPDQQSDVEFIYNELRKATITWSGRKEILALSRRKVFVRRAKNGNPIYKFKWQCAACQNWFDKQEEMEVDHIVEIGGVTEFSKDIVAGIKKMFPRPVKDHLQVLCVKCHLKKTTKYNSARSKWKRK